MYHKSTVIAYAIVAGALFYAAVLPTSAAQDSRAGISGIKVEITSLQEGSSVDYIEIVRGTVSPAIAVKDLRVLVRPIGGDKPGCFINKNWYPQRKLTTKPNGTWEYEAKFDEDGCNFELAAATFTSEGLKRIEKYFEIGDRTDGWHSIPFPDRSSSIFKIVVQRR
ncbi:MAG: hypothetical protein D3913_04660 [Candidatus Electrothrix sp. LOE1_4_5]|nr:hypothetical protein [Candidatus Electrothrix gigas]